MCNYVRTKAFQICGQPVALSIRVWPGVTEWARGGYFLETFVIFSLRALFSGKQFDSILEHLMIDLTFAYHLFNFTAEFISRLIHTSVKWGRI